MKRLYLKYTWIPLIISLIILYLCCFIPIKDIPEVSFDLDIPIDKIVHFLMYFGLSGATALNYIFFKSGHIDMKKLIIGAFIIPILYGGLIEILQHCFFYPRSGDWFDFLADAVGSLVAFPLAILFRNYLLRKQL